MNNLTVILTGCLLSCLSATAQNANPQELANKLANPVSSIISLPLQNNIDWGIGPDNGSKYTLNIQPVIPIRLSSTINLITRYILPVVDQYNITGKESHQFGLSDVTASAFFSPSNHNAVIWGIGPALLFPAGTDEFLTTKKWGAGPTALLLRQSTALTIGFLASQMWSFAGDGNRPQVNQLFVQPFLTHNWKSGAGIGINAEITANWQTKETMAFINPSVSGITKLGKQTVQLSVSPRIPVVGPSGSKPDFGFRAMLSFVFTE